MRLLAPIAFCWVLAGCNDPPGDLRTWRPEDHDHTTNPGQNQVVSGPDAGTSPELAEIGLDEVTVIAWQQNCTRCHGTIGRGDGPQSQMFRPTDLTNPAWQRAVTDDQIFAVIKNGRGQMPPFALPDSTIRSLVRLVRVLDASKHPGTAGAPSGAPQPASSAAPGAASAPAPRQVPSAR